MLTRRAAYPDHRRWNARPGVPWARAWTVAAGGALVAAGCAGLTPVSPRVPSPATIPAGGFEDGYHDVTGVIHIHTRYSDGGGTYEDIALVANQQRLDYLLVSDHNTLKPLADGKQGRYGQTLVLVGCELSTRAGHLLALNIREPVSHRQPVQDIIDQINAQGGLAIAAHPYYRRRRWTDWESRGLAGLEIYNAAHNEGDHGRLWLVTRGLVLPPEVLFRAILDRPYDPLSAWDRLLVERDHVVGIGGADAHEIRVAGLKIAPYGLMFKAVRTHVLIQDATLTTEGFYDALARGRAYVAIDLLGDAAGFQWMARDATRCLGIMGETVTWQPGLQLTATLPQQARMVLFRDGQPVSATTSTEWHIPVEQPGIYRIEATLHGKPWIFSNPITVRR